MLAWYGRAETGGVDGVGAQYASSPQVPWRGMADPAAYPGCVGQSMNFAEHPYEGRGPGHCQSGSGGYPYPGQYRPHPSSPPASYGPPPGQHCGGNYGNGPMPSSPGPYPRQPYPGAVPEMRYGPRHSAPPAYPGSPAPLSKPPGAWDHGMGGGGNYGTRPVMMQSPPQIRSPVSSAPTMHTMGNYRTVVPPGPAGPPMGVAPPPPPHGNVPVPQSQSPSWSQSPRTTPSPLACHARSPAPSQQPPFSPPTPAPTPQLQKPPSPITGSHDPLQSLEKMVLLDPHNSSSGSASYGGMQESSGYGSTSGGGTESGPSSPYPTYYNLDQNRMCTPPDPGPPYGIANFAATGAYRTVLPNMDNNPALRGERTGSGGISVPSSGVYAQPVVNGVNDSDFGSGSRPMAGPPPRSGEFERPYASAGPRGGSPPSDDPIKRRRSLDSTLCNRPSSVGGPGPSAVPSGSGAMDGGGKLRRRSVAGVPDGMNASPVPLTAMPTEQSPAQRVKTEPEVSVSEPERVSVSGAGSVSGTATTTAAVAATAMASATSAASATTRQQQSPTKRKRGRPFGAKNKAKDSGAVVKRRQRKGGPVAHSVVAATPTAVVVTAATTTKVRTPTTGPYVRVLGTRERPLSSHIVNMTPRTVPEDESKRKKVSAPAARVGPHHATGRRLAGSAAHTSTLSPHYDAVTRDPTWLCAFCLKGSHHQGLGDLYGPYPGTVVRPAEPEPTSSQEETLLRRGRATKRKKSDSFSGTEDGTTPRRGSRQQRLSEAEREPEVCKELWVHEACATWSQGVYLGGNRVHGLQEAVAEAAHLVCCKCKLVGASLGCLSRGCSEKYHYLCAVEKGCQLDTENFSILCPKHKKPSARPS